MNYSSIGEIYLDLKNDLFSSNRTHARSAATMLIREAISLFNRKTRNMNDEETASVLEEMNDEMNGFINALSEEAPFCDLLEDDFSVKATEWRSEHA